MNLFLIKLASYIFWIREHPIWTFLLLGTIALIFSFSTFRSSFEISKRLKPKDKRRFAGAFCGWFALACFTVCRLYLPSIEKDTSLPELNLPEEHNLAFLFAFASVMLFLFFLVIMGFEVKTISSKHENQKDFWRFSESIKPLLRMLWRIFLGVSTLFISLTIDFYQTDINFNCTSIIIGISTSSVLILYRALDSSYWLNSFQARNEFEINRIFPKVIILAHVIVTHSSILKEVSDALSAPKIAGALGLVSLFLAFLSFKGIQSSKYSHQNSHLRSLVSLPIAIQSKNGKLLNREQIYDAINERNPHSMIYFESISKGIRETKAELVVVGWQEYAREDIETVRNEFHKTLIVALLSQIETSKNFVELEVINFEIDRSLDGEIEKVVPIENEKIMRLVNLKQALCKFFELGKRGTYKFLKLTHSSKG